MFSGRCAQIENRTPPSPIYVTMNTACFTKTPIWSCFRPKMAEINRPMGEREREREGESEGGEGGGTLTGEAWRRQADKKVS